MQQPLIRRYSKIQIPLHFVWATFERRLLLTPEVERVVLDSIYGNAVRYDCTVLALNAMPDHVHLAVMFTPNFAVKDFVGRIKSLATKRMRQEYGESRFFRWEPNYAVFAFPYAQRDKVIFYIKGQKEHHANNTTYALWEETEVYENEVLRRAGDVESAE